MYAARSFLRSQKAVFRQAAFASPSRAVSTANVHPHSHEEGQKRAGHDARRAWQGEHERKADWTNFFAGWLSWRKQHDTLAWRRYTEQLRDTGAKCYTEAKAKVGQAHERTARYVGAMKAGAPRKPPFQPVGRQLVAYLAPVSQRQRAIRPSLQLAFFEAPVSDRDAFLRQLDVHCAALRSWLNAEVARIFKTSDILSQLNVLTRVAFSLLPLSLAFRFKAARFVRRYGEEALAARIAAKPLSRLIFPSRAFVLSLFAAPLVLFGVAYFASLERTPISGRTRSLFVSDGERNEIIKAFVGERAQATDDDWLVLLRRMLGDEAMGTPQGHLLGGERVIGNDWRLSFVQDTLRTLEAGIPQLGINGVQDTMAAGLFVPEPEPPLAFASPAPEYRLLLIDRPEPNAFSCGFAPIGQGIGPGVIVVFTGAIEAIMRKSVAAIDGQPSLQQREDLAVLLSHELAHLLCSHTLEQHASDLQRPQLRKLWADVLRTFIYPLTWVLGPFVNEALSAALSTGLNDVHGFSSSCESRLHEAEADSVSLRVLANAGFDPRASVRYWEHRIASPPNAQYTTSDAMEGLQWHSNSAAMRQGFLETHPVDAERLAGIKRDLASWERA